MKFICLKLLLVFILFFSFHLASKPAFARHIDQSKKDRCGDYNVAGGECGRPIDTQTGVRLDNTCTYDENTYRCTSEYDNSPFNCIQKSPIDCGNGVTVCGGPTVNDGYNCTKWCYDTYSGYTRPCEILRDTNTVFSDDFPGTGNGRNDNCYNGSRCINPSASGASCTQGSTNCIPIFHEFAS